MQGWASARSQGDWIAHLSFPIVLVRVVSIPVPRAQLDPEACVIRLVSRITWADEADALIDLGGLPANGGLEYVLLLVTGRDGSVEVALLCRRKSPGISTSKP